MRSLSMATGVPLSEIDEALKKLGDVGKVAELIASKRRQATLFQFAKTPLTVERVYSTLDKIAKTTGEGSQEQKMKLLAGLLNDASPKEAKYLVRTVTGRLRLGIADMTILDALAVAFTGLKANREKIERDFIYRKIGTLLSTSTLELGVDYPKVSIVGIVGVPFMLESIPQRVGRAGRDPKATLNTTLAIIILRNTPMELYYIYKPEDLIEGFRKKDIPVAWRNIAVKKYHALFTVFDEMARNGENTYILRTDGRLADLTEFIEKIIEYIDEVRDKLSELDSRTEADKESPSKIIEEIKRELRMIPHRLNEWKKLHEGILEAYDVFAIVRRIAWQVRRLAKKLNYRKLELESNEILRELWKIAG